MCPNSSKRNCQIQFKKKTLNQHRREKKFRRQKEGTVTTKKATFEHSNKLKMLKQINIVKKRE